MSSRRRVLVDGTELVVTVEGDGPPVLVLHGFTGSAAAMEPLTEPIARSHRLIAPDMVGHGESASPTHLARYTVAAMGHQVLTIADALECRTFHLVGYSMGGRVALWVGCTAPERLRSLSLIGATAGIADEAGRADRRAGDEARADSIESDLVTFVDEWMANPLFAGQRTLGEGFLARSRAQRLASDARGLANSLRGGGTGAMIPLHDRLHHCAVPTLLVVGEHDARFRAVAEDLDRVLPTSSVAVVPGAGHATHLEAAEATAARVLDHISRTDPA
ncbi:MAG: alpha/beta fold hydrolase [Acidimicrobiales bacterium]